MTPTRLLTAGESRMFLALGCPGQVISGMSCLPSWLGYQLRLRWPSWSSPHSGVTGPYSVSVTDSAFDYSRVDIMPTLRCGWLGLHSPAVRLCLPYATATRPGSPWGRLALLLCDGIDSFSWIGFRCCGYSRVTSVSYDYLAFYVMPAFRCS